MTIPNTFHAGEIISSSEMNENFAAVDNDIATRAKSADLAASTGAAGIGTISGQTVQNRLTGLGMTFNTIALLQAATVPAAVNYITLRGYYAANDNGGHVRYRGVSTDPGAVQSADGAWWSVPPLNDREIHAAHFGAKFDGVTDDTTAINNAISALVALANSFSAASWMLVLPAGRAITQGAHTIPSTVRVRVVGAGAYTTILYQKNSTNAAFILDVQGQYSSVENLSLNGNRDNNPTGTDALRINGAFVLVSRVFATEASNDGIVLGNLATAINSRLLNVDVRYCKGYGVNISGANSSTDCQFTDVNVGTSGKSGFLIASPGQKLTNCHSWGNGIEDATNNHGFQMTSGASMLVGCEAESNLGRGVYIGSGIKGISIVGGTIWGNCANGVYIFGATQCVLSGISIRNNGVSNVSGAASNAFANVFVDNATYITVVGCNMYDDAQNFSAGTYRTTPPYPYPGRTGIFTVRAHYAEGSGSTNNTIVGNSMPRSLTRSGFAIINVGVLNRYSENVTGETALITLASAATVTLPAEHQLVQITGTTAITSIVAAAPGRRVTLQFASAGCVVTAGSNLLIGSSYTSTAGGTLGLICDGTNWYRIT